METVTQWWNITRALANSETADANKLRTHYIQCCRELSDEVELPKQFFGPATMCAHCGSLWSVVDHKVRIVKGKRPSNAIRKLMRAGKHSKYQQKLVNKCSKAQANKVVATCSHCKQKTVVHLNKPKRLQAEKIKDTGVTPKKKKKRKSRDRNAGLIIDTPKPSVSSSNMRGKVRKVNLTYSTTKQIDLSKLKGMIDATNSPAEISSLDSFLTQID